MLNFIKNEAGLTPNRICILPTTTNVPSVISIKKQHQLTPNFINLNLKIMKNIILIIKKLVLVFCSLLSLAACSSDDDGSKVCDEQVIVDSVLFTDAPNEQVTINSIQITDDCLQINFSASGCSGNRWEFTLIDSGDIQEGSPAIRTLRLSFKGNEACLAFLTREVSFDIQSLQIQGSSQVLLKIANNDSQILYEY